jgi:mannosyltransferase
MAVAGRFPGPAPSAPAAAGGAAARSRPETFIALGAIVVLGAVVRFTTLAEQSFWFDEATTWGIVAHGLHHVLAAVPRTESTPYTYYVLLWLWSKLFGISEAGLRSFSALCSLLVIPVLYAAGRRLAGERAGLVAALLAAVNPLLFWYAQEARAYSLLLLLAAVSLLAWLRALDVPSRRRALVWGLSGAAALAAHYYAAVLVAGEAAALGVVLARRRRLSGPLAAAGLAPILIVGGALLPLLLHQNDGRAAIIAQTGGSLPHRLLGLIKEDIIGQGQPAKALLTGLGVLLVVAGLIALLRRPRELVRSQVGLVAAVGTGAIALALLLAALVSDYFNTRNLLETWPALCLVLAAAIAATRPPRAAALITAGLVVLSLFCVGTIIADPGYQRTDWGGAAARLGPARMPRAIVTGTQSLVPLTPYLPRLSVLPLTVTRPLREVDLIWVQRRFTWGALATLHPVALPGFASVRIFRTAAYVVVRYRAARPVPETAGALDRLYSPAYPALTLLQG